MNTNTIKFDPTDWDSIRDTIDKINNFGVQLGTTSEEENILFDLGKDDDGNDYLITSVFQSNRWIRKNYYYPNDYIIEEIYQKE